MKNKLIGRVISERFGFYLGLDNEKNPNVRIFCAMSMPFIASKNGLNKVRT